MFFSLLLSNGLTPKETIIDRMRRMISGFADYFRFNLGQSYLHSSRLGRKLLFLLLLTHVESFVQDLAALCINAIEYYPFYGFSLCKVHRVIFVSEWNLTNDKKVARAAVGGWQNSLIRFTFMVIG